MLIKRFSRRGFTVVEVVVVIVVIGIIATITTVAYKNMTMQSRNAKTAEAVSKYLEVLHVYYSMNNKFPDRGSGSGGVCLGRAAYPSGTCWNDTITTDNAFMSALENHTKTKLPEPAVSKTTGAMTGMWFSPYTAWVNGIDGQQAQFLVYMVEGSGTRCPVGPVATRNGWNFISTPPENGISIEGSNYSECWIPLPPHEM